MSIRLRGVILSGLFAASCSAPAVVAPTPTTAPTFAASECTSPTATTRQIIERYFALSTSNDAQAVTDCFARVWRDKTATFAEGAALWARSGPATSVTITFVDAVNGCDRFGVNAQLSNPAFRVPPFFSVGTEAGRPRIYETSTALANSGSTTLRCGA